MKPTELMIGDWVNVKTTNRDTRKEETKPGRIVEISPYFKNAGIAFDINDFKRHYGFNQPLASLAPIPLTGEVLERNGFKKSEVFDEWKYEENDVSIQWKPYPLLFLQIETEDARLSIDCGHVHELQHALQLCGVERELEL